MLELAGRLRELPRDDLAAALRSREFDATGVGDLFDLAESLLAPDSVDRAIARLDRPRLAAPAPPVLVGDDPVDRSLLERRSSDAAYASVAATAELLAALGAQPAREL